MTSHSESFTTTTYRDPGTTTIAWDTGSGLLRLDPFYMSVLATSPGGGATGYLDVTVHGNRVYAVYESSLRVFDIVNPSSPVQIGSAALAATGASIVGGGDLAFVGEAGGRLQAFDITGATPVAIGLLSALSDDPNDLAWDGQYVYAVTAVDALDVVDVSVPSRSDAHGRHPAPDRSYEGYAFNDCSTTAVLQTPSARASGIEVDLAEPIPAEPGLVVIVVVDFDVNDNFRIQGNPETPARIHGILFTPVLKEKSRDSEPDTGD